MSIQITNLKVLYPEPRRYKDLILRPFSRIKKFKALEIKSLKLEEGDRIGIMGKNGAGKTTFLKTVGGLIYPTEGSVVIYGKNSITHNNDVRNLVGYVINEDRSFYWRLTGEQNLNFFGTLDNLPPKKLAQKTEEWLQRVELSEFRHRKVSDYSSGMRQRLAIVRGLIADPSILILDEPTRTLDPIAANNLRELIKEEIQKKEKKTLFIATHQPSEIEFLCNKVCVFKKGNLIAFDKVDAMLARHGSIERYYRSINH